MYETGLTASTRRFMERRDGSSHGSISRGNDFTEGRGGGDGGKNDGEFSGADVHSNEP